MASTKPIVGYFDIRGRAEPIRLLLTYAGVDFTDKRYPYRGFGGDRSEWLADKFSLGMEFPNVPYYFEGDLKLTQTTTILHYLARKHGLAGADEATRIRIDLLEQQVFDHWSFYYMYLMNQHRTEEETKNFPKTINAQLEATSKFFGSGPYSAGAEITYVDFWLYEYLNAMNTAELTKGSVEPFGNLMAFLKRIEELPQLAEYIKSVKAKEAEGMKE